jgi:hypothetical protein
MLPCAGRPYSWSDTITVQILMTLMFGAGPVDLVDCTWDMSGFTSSFTMSEA